MLSRFNQMPKLKTTIYRSDQLEQLQVLCCKSREKWRMQTLLHEHFLQDDHHGFLNHAHVTLIDKTPASNPNKTVFFDENP